jgi:hypothetical protein
VFESRRVHGSLSRGYEKFRDPRIFDLRHFWAIFWPDSSSRLRHREMPHGRSPEAVALWINLHSCPPAGNQVFISPG